MKRFTSIVFAFVFVLGLAMSAQAVNISMPNGTTANAVFGAVDGVKFVNDRTEIASILASSSTTYFDLSVLASHADLKNSLGDYNNKGGLYGSFHQLTAFNKVTGVYNYNAKIKEDVLLSDVYVNMSGEGVNKSVKLSQLTAAMFDTNYYAAAPSKNGSHTSYKFQMFTVTDTQVEINGNVFYQGSIILALDDGRFGHTDFNDLVFVLAAKNPPAVPIPSAAVLLLPGLAGIAAMRRKMK